MRLLIATILCLMTLGAQAETISVIVPTSPGSVVDTIARTVTKQLSNDGNTYVIENTFGAAGDLALSKLVSRSKEQTPTIMFGFSGTFIYNQFNSQNTEDRSKNVVFIPPPISNPQMLIASEGTKITDLQGEGKFVGEISEVGILASNLFNKKSVLVRYKTLADLVMGVKRNDVNYSFVGFDPSLLTMPGIKILAVIAPQRLEKYPQYPTLKELGYDITVQSSSLWVLSKDQTKIDAKQFEARLKEIYQSSDTKELLSRLGLNEESELRNDQDIRNKFRREAQQYKDTK